MKAKVVCLIASMIVTASVDAAEGSGFYSGASYLNIKSGFEAYSDDADGFELDLGYSLGPHFAMEVSYLDLGTLNLPNTPDSGGKISSDGVSLQMVAKVPLNRFTVYGKLGSLWWNRSGQLVTIAGPVPIDVSGSDVTYGLGCGYAVTPHLLVDVEYSRTGYGNDSSLSSLGLSYRF